MAKKQLKKGKKLVGAKTLIGFNTTRAGGLGTGTPTA